MTDKPVALLTLKSAQREPRTYRCWGDT